MNGYAISSTGPGEEITNIQYNITGTQPGETITRVTDGTAAVTDYVMQPENGALRTTRVNGGCSACGGRDSTYVYDDNGRLIRQQHADGYVTVSKYPADRLTRIEDHMRPASCDPATDVNHCRLDSAALATTALTATASSVATTNLYADTFWPDRVTEISTTSVRKTNEVRREQFSYDAATGQMRTHKIEGWTGPDDPPLHETDTITTTLYDGYEGAAFDPQGTYSPSWLSLPQPAGERKSIDGVRIDVADVTLFVYYPVDPSVPPDRRGRLAAIRNAAGHVARFEDYDVFGNVLRSVDSNGVATEYTYDSLGRPLTTTLKGQSFCDASADPLCGTDLTTSRTYSAVNGPLASEQRAGGGVSQYIYDGRGRIQTMSRGASLSSLTEQIEYAYDPATGKKSVERNLAYQSGAWVEKRRDTYHYDALGQLADVTHADNSAVAYTYDAVGNLATVRDENHALPTTTYAYDPANRLASVTQKLGTGTIVTRYAYDVQGNLSTLTDPNGNVTSYVYDDFGRMLRQSSPVTGTTTYSYDAAGNLVSTTDANGATTTRTYDELNRVTSATASSRAAGTEALTWTYDEPASGANGIGRVASMTDPTGSTRYRYERRGLLANEQKTIESAIYETRFSYDADGNRSRIVSPSGRIESRSFDFAGRPNSVASGSIPIVTATTYLPFGPAATWLFGNGTTRSMEYDQRYRPLRNTLSGPGGVQADYSYAEDLAGNITQIHDVVSPSYNRDFGYDDLNRLTAASTGSSLWGSGTYQYDAMGNVRSLSLGASRSAVFTYAGTTPKLASVMEGSASRTVPYDAAGNENSVGAIAFAYSPRNQLATTDSDAYAYDARGIRTITVSQLRLGSVSLRPANIVGGSSSTLTVTLSAPAPAGGVNVALLSSNAAVVVPGVVTIAAGEVSSDIVVQSSSVSAPVIATITATLDDKSATATLTVSPTFSVATLAIQPSRVTGGRSSTATVSLTGPAPSEGAILTLSSNNAAAIVPDAVSIDAGETGVDVTVTTSVVTAITNATITASLNGSTATATVEIDPPLVASVSLNPVTVVAGTHSTGTVTLSGAASPGGVIVALSSNRAEAPVQAAVTVAPGASSATFDIPTSSAVGAETVATITATTGAVSATATLTIEPQPIVLTAVTLSSTTVTGGQSLSGAVVLASPATGGAVLITLSTSDEELVSIPLSVAVAPGAATASFSIQTSLVSSVENVTITASYQGISQSAALTITPPSGTVLFSLTIDPANVVGGEHVTAVLTLSAPAPKHGADIDLTSSNTDAARVPDHVDIGEGRTSKTIDVTTRKVQSAQAVTISGSYGGITQSDSLMVIPASAIKLVSLTLSPTTVMGGGHAQGTVTMSAAAPAGGVMVSIKAKEQKILTIPSTVTVEGGATAATFDIATSASHDKKDFEITATLAAV